MGILKGRPCSLAATFENLHVAMTDRSSYQKLAKAVLARVTVLRGDPPSKREQPDRFLVPRMSFLLSGITR